MNNALTGYLFREPAELQPIGFRIEVTDATREAEKFVARWPRELKERTGKLTVSSESLTLTRPNGGLQEISFHMHPEDAQLLERSLSDPTRKHTIVASEGAFGFILLPQGFRLETVESELLQVRE